MNPIARAKLDNTSEKRFDLVHRLENAGCPIDLSGTDWLTEGNFEIGFREEKEKKRKEEEKKEPGPEISIPKGTIYCSRCGALPGQKSKCTNLTGFHDFVSD